MRLMSVLLCFFCITSSAYGDIFVQQEDSAGTPISVRGKITTSDLAALIELSSNKKSFNVITLESIGGDVATALKMGEFIRSKNFLVMVPENAVCLSSCVFLLAGGVKRIVVGNVGIHRPFSPEDSITTEDGQKNKYKRLEATIKDYFKKMNIPIDLYNEMLPIAPSDMRILTMAELKHFGLSEDDPYLKEAEVTRFARKVGINKGEYYRREARMKRCNGLRAENANQCVLRVLEEPL